MEKVKIRTLLISLVLVAALMFVYAWATDTDGGYNIWQRGTCSDDTGNYTDYCQILIGNKLVEYYPINDTNSTYCTYAIVNCLDYNATCEIGECVLINRTLG